MSVAIAKNSPLTFEKSKEGLIIFGLNKDIWGLLELRLTEFRAANLKYFPSVRLAMLTVENTLAEGLSTEDQGLMIFEAEICALRILFCGYSTEAQSDPNILFLLKALEQYYD